MGTAISVELVEQRGSGEAAITAVMDEMHRIDRTMSPHKEDSELSRINRGAGSRAVPVSPEMARLIVRAAEFSALSGGAFDITYAAVGQLYDYRTGFVPPTPSSPRRAPRSAGATSSSTARPERCASPARDAHRPRRLRQGPCGRQRGGDPAPPRHRATRW